jgi:hypothetical protein
MLVLHVQFYIWCDCYVGQTMALGYQKLLVRLSTSGEQCKTPLNLLLFITCDFFSVLLQSISNDIWWYYMVSMAFYWSLTASQFFDVRRKDFWQMFAHHMITILLIALSWVCNLHRVGSLVLLVHDCADIFLEAAKITKYANYQKVCDIIFAVFTVVWISTRLGLYPRILYSTTVEAPQILPMFPAYYIFNSLLVLLLLLHIGWTYLIIQIAIKALKSGQVSYAFGFLALNYLNLFLFSSTFFRFEYGRIMNRRKNIIIFIFSTLFRRKFNNFV